MELLLIGILVGFVAAAYLFNPKFKQMVNNLIKKVSEEDKENKK